MRWKPVHDGVPPTEPLLSLLRLEPREVGSANEYFSWVCGTSNEILYDSVPPTEPLSSPFISHSNTVAGVHRKEDCYPVCGKDTASHSFTCDRKHTNENDPSDLKNLLFC